MDIIEKLVSLYKEAKRPEMEYSHAGPNKAPKLPPSPLKLPGMGPGKPAGSVEAYRESGRAIRKGKAARSKNLKRLGAGGAVLAAGYGAKKLYDKMSKSAALKEAIMRKISI